VKITNVQSRKKNQATLGTKVRTETKRKHNNNKKKQKKPNPSQNLNKKYRQQKIKDQHGHYPKTDGTTDSHNAV
jgi:hypothetical protein